jgi:F-type H+-transporting ATPase subunit b
MEIFAKLGIDWRLLLAQLVNFVILFSALTFLLYKPILGVLERRGKKIADSLKDAEKISEELRSAEDKSRAVLSEARSEAGKIVAAARAETDSARAIAVEKAKAEVAAVIASGRGQLAAERDAMVNEVRAVAAELVATATEKIIGEKMSDAKDKHLIEKLVKNS